MIRLRTAHHRRQLVPTVLRGNAVLDALRPLATGRTRLKDDAERRRWHSDAERRNVGTRAENALVANGPMSE
jgi:hypothetical protein